jgi:hemin uptake protein HemP
MSKAVVEIGVDALSAEPEHGVQIGANAEAKRFSARRLFGDSRELVIEHGGDEYRLRITNAGKLILTK